MTYAQLREHIGRTLTLEMARACGVKAASLRQMVSRGDSIPEDRLRCILLALEKHGDRCTAARRIIEGELEADKGDQTQV